MKGWCRLIFSIYYKNIIISLLLYIYIYIYICYEQKYFELFFYCDSSIYQEKPWGSKHLFCRKSTEAKINKQSDYSRNISEGILNINTANKIAFFLNSKRSLSIDFQTLQKVYHLNSNETTHLKLCMCNFARVTRRVENTW